jgi:hypothetical protein
MPKPNRPMSFREVQGHFKLLDVNYMPYRNGGGFFIGSDPAKSPGFPYSAGPVCHVSARHKDDDIIPLKVILNWFHRLTLTDKQIEQFWAIEDHDQPGEEAR